MSKKYTQLFLGVVLLCCIAGRLAAQTVRIDATRSNLAQVVISLQKQAPDYKFSFQQEALEKIKINDLHLQAASVTAALQQLQKQYGLQYLPDGNIISLKYVPAANHTAKEPGKIAGYITDEENGEPVMGAAILIGETGVTSDIDGAFSLPLPAGHYTATISFIGYGAKEITGIEVKANEATLLNITLKREKGNLSGIVVRSSARQESVNALLAHQKNAAEVTNGISAEQISRTPDKNIGESLKRISGVSTNDNKFVVVRGIGERYNAVMLDGVLLPGTEAQSREFSFDLIPTNLVDNVVVSKTVTPDMAVSFGGGLIQINTKDIPVENFTTISGGLSWNDQATGKDFYSRKRGKYDLLGFDDGHRGAYPTNLRPTQAIYYPGGQIPIDIYEQSRQFRNNDNFSTYRYTAAPSQNYQFSMGRLLNMRKDGRSKLGFTGAVSYRNTQTASTYSDLRRGSWNQHYSNHGNTYTYNTTWGALLNIGWQLGSNRFSLRNTYTRMYDNTMWRTLGFDQDASLGDATPPSLREVDDPVFLDLLQNKLAGLHQWGKVKLEWNISRAAVSRNEKDVIITGASPVQIGKEYVYYYQPGSSSEPEDLPMSRSVYRNKGTYYTGSISASIPLHIGQTQHTFKTGYSLIRKSARFDWQIATFANNGRYFADSLRYLPVGEWGQHMTDSTGYIYAISPWFLDSYEGRSQNHAGFVMMDSRLYSNLRLVWGLRAEYYEYKEISNGNSTKVDWYTPKEDIRWQWMPSANLTYSPFAKMNLRASWSNSVVRPELMDNSRFKRYSPYYDGDLSNAGISSTKITSCDVKAEWFPGGGEVLSAGAFYKYFDKPVELVANNNTGNLTYLLQNSISAKVYGIELEARKNLRFLADRNWLGNTILFGNVTLQTSSVQGSYTQTESSGTKYTYLFKEKRALYGQVPFLLNAGVQYTGKHLGLNIAYNKAGYKTNIVSNVPTLMEREMPREQLDAQLSYRLLSGKLECRLNMGNILNAPFRFYKNLGVVQKADFDIAKSSSIDWSDRFEYKPGFSDKYEEGDMRTFTRYLGRTFSATIAYNF